MGQPLRVLNVILHPTLNSVMFFDMIVLSGYLFLNPYRVDGFGAERKEVPPPKWVKPLIYLSIAWAPSIHTVTAFLYAGIPGRHFGCQQLWRPDSWHRPLQEVLPFSFSFASL